MDAAVAALAGAAIGSSIGALGAFGAAWSQQREQSRREIARTAADLAIADHAVRFEAVKGSSMPILPLSYYVAYHADVLRVVSSGEQVDAAKLAEIDNRSRALIAELR